MDRPDHPRQVPMAAPSIPWHVCDDCLEPLAKRIASQAGGYSAFIPGRIVVSDLLQWYEFDSAIEVIAATVSVPYAEKVQARVSAVQEAVRQVNRMGFEYWQQEHGPLPDDCSAELQDDVWTNAAWDYLQQYWRHLWEDYTPSHEVKTIADSYQKLFGQTKRLARYLFTVSTTVRAQVDAATMNARATTLQTCLHRLQHLQTWFKQVENPQQLVDATQEGGHILALLVRDQHLAAEELLPSGAEIVADYVSQALADRRKANPMETEGMAKFTQRALWELIALEGTDRQRLLMHPPTELAPGILAQSTDYKSNYRRQGMQFSLLAGQILEKLEAVAAAAQQASSSKKPGKTKGPSDFTEEELVEALIALLRNSDRYYTAQQAADELKRRYPGKKIGRSRVDEHPQWNRHAIEWGKTRAPRNTSRQARDSAISKLVKQQDRNIAADAGKTVRGNKIAPTDH